MQKKNILAISGSTKKDSSNVIILNTIAEIFKEQLAIEVYTKIDKLPHFSPDIANENVSSEIKELLQKIDQADGVVICSPEYVFSLPAVLKNALEWTVGTLVFSNKPVTFIIVSASGEKAYESLDLILATLVQSSIPDNLKLLIKGGRKFISTEGQFTDQTILNKIEVLVRNFIHHIDNKHLTNK